MLLLEALNSLNSREYFTVPHLFQAESRYLVWIWWEYFPGESSPKFHPDWEWFPPNSLRSRQIEIQPESTQIPDGIHLDS